MGKIQTFNTKYGVGSWQKSNKQSRLPIFLIMLLVTLVITNTTAQQNIFIAPQVQSTQGGHTNVNNFALDFTIGEPVQTSLQSGNLMLTQGFEQMEKPLPPVAPAPQAVCSDTAVTFVFEDMIAGTGADQLEWSYTSTFNYSYFAGCDSALKIGVNIGSTDTIWMRSRVSGNGMVSKGVVYTILKVNFKPDAPTPPAPQSIASDTAFPFVFENTEVGFGANQLEWALDSNFTSSHIDTPLCTISITVPPDSFQMIWLRSKDTVTGCVSDTRTTILIVDTIGVPHIIYDSVMVICKGTSTTFSVANTDTDLRYDLKVDTVTVATAFGNDTTLNLSTGNIDTITVFIVYSVDTTTHSTLAIDTLVIIPYAAVDTPEFIIGDTLIFLRDTSSYFAMAENSIKTVYSLVGAGADIDSIEGTLTNITDSNLIIRATAKGLSGCGTTSADLHIKVTDMGIPVTSSVQEFIIDSPMVATFTTDTILAGAGGDQIQWAFNPVFTGSHTVSSPATISISLATSADTIIYLRSGHSGSKKYSKAITKQLRVLLPTVSAGLLDKSKWQLNWAEEFSYSNLQAFRTAGKWALNFTWSSGGNTWTNEQMEQDCINHAIWNGGFSGGEYTNYGATGGGLEEHGSGGELSFPNTGYALFTATKLPMAEIRTCNGTSQIFRYKSSNITRTGSPAWTIDPSKRTLIEMRCQEPAGVGAHPAFWTWCTNGKYQEYDIMENSLSITDDVNLAITNIHDWHDDACSTGSTSHNCNVVCGHAVYKRTSCNYSQDWHTYSMVLSTNEIILFVDGKETWSHNRQQSGTPIFPTNMITNAASRLMIGIGVDAWTRDGNGDLVLDGSGNPIPFANEDSYEMKVDYIRYYEPVATNTSNPPQCFQNIQSSLPKTLESPTYNPSLQAHQDPQNNKKSFVVGSPNNETYNISQKSRITVLNTGLSAKPFYRITQFNNGACAYLENYNSINNWWRQKIINPTVGTPALSPFTTVKDWVTPLNTDRIYFQSSLNKLRYYQKVNINIIAQTYNWAEGTPYIWYQQNRPLPDCGGSVATDNQQRVWFRGTSSDANNLYSWNPGTGQLGSAVLNYSDGSTDVVVHSCGCLAFYRDAGGQLRQLSWGVNGNGVWNEITLPALTYHSTGVSIVNIRGAMVLDETNARVYFIGSDQFVYYYAYDFNHGVTGGLHRLEDAGVENKNNTTLCGNYNNALYDLALSNDKNTLYYRGNDGNIWYYYNDREYSSVTNQTGQTIAISKPNWNKTPLKWSTAVGRIGLEKSNTGKLFYVGNDYKLYAADWTNADNWFVCPNTPSNWSKYNSYKTDGGDEQTNSTDERNIITKPVKENSMQVSVYPNPSLNSFAITIFNAESNSSFELRIEDMNGRKMFERKGNTSDSEIMYQLVWDAKEANAGVYLYKIKVGNETATGKMVKM